MRCQVSLPASSLLSSRLTLCFLHPQNSSNSQIHITTDNMHLWTAIVLQYLTVDALAYFMFAGSNSDLVVGAPRNSPRVTGEI